MLKYYLSQIDTISKKISLSLSKNDCIFLYGELGVGKTTFVRFCLEALGWEGKVKSPTFGLIEEYHLQSIKLIHTDLYRLNSSDEFDYFGVDLDFQSHGAIFIEWPEKIEKFNRDDFQYSADLPIGKNKLGKQ